MERIDYRSILDTELKKRAAINPAYSLRRFAQSLKLSPATLSGVLQGKRNLSIKSAAQVCEALSFPPEIATAFLQSVVSDQTSLPKNAGPEVLQPYHLLGEDVFRVMADWYYYAILELTFVRGSTAEPEWYARKLGISDDEAQIAIERLKKLGLLELRRGKLVKAKAFVASPDQVPSAAVRNRHRQILRKAEDALGRNSIDERDFSSMTMAIDPTLIPKAKKKILEFRRQLCSFLTGKNKRRVYELSIQLFPLSEKD
jgi:uncharacterized protein (TIGR02147 family)